MSHWKNRLRKLENKVAEWKVLKEEVDEEEKRIKEIAEGLVVHFVKWWKTTTSKEDHRVTLLWRVPRSYFKFDVDEYISDRIMTELPGVFEWVSYEHPSSISFKEV